MTTILHFCDLLEGSEAILVGWGAINVTMQAKKLMKIRATSLQMIRLKVVKRENCKITGKLLKAPGIFCAGKDLLNTGSCYVCYSQ